MRFAAGAEWEPRCRRVEAWPSGAAIAVAMQHHITQPIATQVIAEHAVAKLREMSPAALCRMAIHIRCDGAACRSEALARKTARRRPL
ncbi:hypothetical protein Ms3S1_02240 [Methylosinus sp. 3S-1]